MAEQKNDWDFSDLRPKSKRFDYGGQTFVAREPSAGAWTLHQDRLWNSAKINKEGRVERFEMQNQLEPLLVGDCVFSLSADGKESSEPIGEATAKAWHPKVIDTVFLWLVQAANGGATEADVPPKPSAAGPS